MNQHASMKGFGMLGAMGALLALGGAVAIAINMMPGEQERESVDETQKIIPRISDMLTDFAASHNRLPCPDFNGNGVEGDANGDCTTSKQVGTIPWRALRLSGQVVDGMGVPIRYAVFRDTTGVDLTVASNSYTPPFPTLKDAASIFTFNPLASVVHNDLVGNSTLSVFGQAVDSLKSAIPGGDLVLPGNFAQSFSLAGLLSKPDCDPDIRSPLKCLEENPDSLVSKMNSGSSAVNLYDFCYNLEQAQEVNSGSVLSITNSKEAALAYKAAYDAEYDRIKQQNPTLSTALITKAAKEAGEAAARAVGSRHPAYLLVSGNRIDADQDDVDGAFDGLNEGTDPRFDDPFRGRSASYDDVLMAMPLDKLEVNLGCRAFRTAVDGLVRLTQDMTGAVAGAQKSDMDATFALVQGYYGVLTAGFDLLSLGTCSGSQAQTAGMCAPNFPAGTAGAIACSIASGVCIACGVVVIPNFVAATLSAVTSYRNKVASSETVDSAVLLLDEMMDASWGIENYGALYPFPVKPITNYGGLVMGEIDQATVDAAQVQADQQMEEMEEQRQAQMAASNAEILASLAEVRAQAETDKQYLNDMETTITAALTARGMTKDTLTTERFPLPDMFVTDGDGNMILVAPAFSLSSDDLSGLSRALDLDEEMRDAALSPGLRARISIELGDFSSDPEITGNPDPSLLASYRYIPQAPRGPYEGDYYDALIPPVITEEVAEKARKNLHYIRDEIMDGQEPPMTDKQKEEKEATESAMNDQEAAAADVDLDDPNLPDDAKAMMAENSASLQDARTMEAEEKELKRSETRQLQQLVAFDDIVEAKTIKELLTEIEEGVIAQDALIVELDCAKGEIEGSPDPSCP
ncbi:MAG: hypothetical protein HQL50_00565 [Magnetococcales bacterium]|nr:hypothetical protein [Magnetococcales bacterium]